MDILKESKEGKNEEDIWIHYLKKNIKFPLKTSFMAYDIRQFPSGAPLELVKVMDSWDEELGALGKVRHRNKIMTTAVSELSPNEASEALSIYLYWFANK